MNTTTANPLKENKSIIKKMTVEELKEDYKRLLNSINTGNNAKVVLMMASLLAEVSRELCKRGNDWYTYG
jgi:hypothetical protein